MKRKSEDSLQMSEEESLRQGQESISWIDWHCSVEGHEFLASVSRIEFFIQPQVDPQFVKENFNQSGLKKNFSNYSEALQMILGESPESDDLEKESFSVVYQQAFDLYGLIHARFIQTPKGLLQIKAKYDENLFGNCPRVQCGNQPVLPIGLSDDLNVAKVKIYCPKCEDIFVPKGQRSAHSTSGKGCKALLDGAYFGKSFPLIFLMNFQKLAPEFGPETFTPSVFGFKICGQPGSKYFKGL